MTSSIINVLIFIALGVIGGVMTSTVKLLGAALIVLSTAMIVIEVNKLLTAKITNVSKRESAQFLTLVTAIAGIIVFLATLFFKKIIILWSIILILAVASEIFALTIMVFALCSKRTNISNVIALALAGALIVGSLLFVKGLILWTLIVIAITAIAISVLRILKVPFKVTMIIALAAIIITIPFFTKSCDKKTVLPNTGIPSDTTAVTTDSVSDTTITDDTTSVDIWDTGKYCPPVEHHWDAGVQDCDKLLYTCTNCGQQRIEDVPQTSAPDTTPDTAPDTQAPHTHSYACEVTKTATCKAVGVKTYTCGCGDIYTEEIPKTSHKYSETVVKAATEYEAGCKKFECRECGTSYTESIPRLTHKTHKYAFDKILVEATCGNDGTAQYKCPCGATEQRKVAATGEHKWDGGSRNGDMVLYTCNTCGTTLSKNEPCNHLYVSEVVEKPTAYEGGTVRHTCSYCDDSYTEVTPALVLKLTASATEMVWGDTITIKTNGYAFNLVLVNDDIAKLEIIDENTIEVVLTNENAGGSLVVYDMIMPTTQVEIIILPNLG